MTRKILTRLSLLAALLAWAGPALAGSVALNYATDRKVVHACILGADPNNPPAPYALYLLDRSEQSVTVAASGTSFVFYPPKPRGWEFENPLAVAGMPKTSPAYWGETLASLDLPRMANYDLILLPVGAAGVTALSRDDRMRLANWVDMGGLLWIDRLQEATARDLTLFLEPTLSFIASDVTLPASKVAVDPSHPLLRGRFILSSEEIELLGRQLSYRTSPVGESPLDGMQVVGTTPSALTEVVGARRTERDGSDTAYYPVVAAARFGSGAVVVTACGVAQGIQDWLVAMEGGTAPLDLELAQWSLPDFKFAYNMIQWALDWSAQQGGSRHQGRFAGLLPGPLSPTWVYPGSAAPAGAPAVERGMAHVGWSDGVLSLFDVVPSESRAGGAADDGSPLYHDYADGAASDQVAWLPVHLAALGTVTDASDVAIVGSPALATVYDAAGQPGAPRPIAVVAARNAGGDLAGLFAYCADPDVFANPGFEQTNPYAYVPRWVSYAVGTVSVVQGSQVVTGAGTLWQANVRGADLFRVAGEDRWYWVSSVDSDTQITLTEPYEAAGGSGLGYETWAIYPVWQAATSDAGGAAYGLVTTGPVVADNMIVLATSDSGSNQAPNRDGQLLVYEAAPASAGETKTPTALVRLARGGQAMSLSSPPAVAYATVWDDALNTMAIAQVAVLTGNGLPRVDTAATGQLRVVPLAVRFPASGWDHVWLADAAGSQTAANQLVQIETSDGVQIPPHQDDDVTAPLNYVRRVEGNYIEIVFTRFALFRGLYDTKGQPLKISFRDTSGVTRTVSADLQPGYATFLRSEVADNGHSSPMVAGDIIVAAGKAIDASPNNSVHGNVTALDLTVSRAFATRWVFEGDVTGGPNRVDPDNPRDYYISFPFTPAYAGDTVYAAGNYEFSQAPWEVVDRQGAATATNGSTIVTGVGTLWTQTNVRSGDEFRLDDDGVWYRIASVNGDTQLTLGSTYAQAGGTGAYTIRRADQRETRDLAAPAGALYALNAKASPNLLSVSPSDPKVYDPATATLSADPTLAGGLPDLEAPVGATADPNQAVPTGERGVPVWITTQTDPGDVDNYDAASYAIPQRSGTTVNWEVDFVNGIIRLAPGAFGTYQGRTLRVRYFNGGAIPNGGDGVIVRADRLVNWVYHFARFDGATGAEVASAQIISPPVAAQGAVHVMVRSNVEQPGTDTYRRYLVSVHPNPAEGTAADRLINPWGEPTAHWQPVGPPVSNEEIVAGLAATGGRVIAATQIGSEGYVEGLANVGTVVADNERVVEAQGEAQMAWAGLGSREPDAAEQVLVYSAGTVDAVQGQAQVTGLLTEWVANATAGYWFRVRGGTQPWYLIQSVDSDTQITLAELYAGPDATGAAYDIARASTMDQDLPAYDSYADSAYRGFSRASGVRHLAGGRLLVTDTGHDRVVEVDRGGDVAWEYPGLESARTLYFAGLATTDGSAVVTGSGTLWTSIVSPGDRFRIDGDTNWYTVESVDGDGQLTLTAPYADPGGANLDYTIVHIHREVTPQEQRLLGPLDARRYRKRMEPVAGAAFADPSGELNRSYAAGTATATNGSATVTGSGTLWASYVRPGDWFRVDADGEWYVIASVDGDGQITLVEAYGEAGGGDVAYTITSPVVVEWEATLIADAGNNRVLEVMRPLLNGKYRPWVHSVVAQLTTADGYGQAQVTNGSNVVVRSGGTLSWVDAIRTGDYFRLDADGVWYRVGAVVWVGPNPDDELLTLSRPYTGGSATGDFTVERRAYATQYSQEVLGPKTTFNGAAMGIKLNPSWAQRAGNPDTDDGRTTDLVCATASNPPDPSGQDRYVSVVGAQVTYQVAPLDPRVVATSIIVPRTGGGINLFAPRSGVARDFLRVRQAEQIPVGVGLYTTLLVDDAGVKEIDNTNWASDPTPLFEFNAAGYLAEMQALKTQLEAYGSRPPYPALIHEPSDLLREEAYQDALTYASDTVNRQLVNGQVDFAPAAAWKNRASGAYTVVNAYGDPYQALGGEPIGARVKSEVFELDPRLDLALAYRAGKQIVRWDFDSSMAGELTDGGDSSSPLYGFGSWPHFILPDPSRSVYPWIAGASYGLKQPRGVDRH